MEVTSSILHLKAPSSLGHQSASKRLSIANDPYHYAGPPAKEGLENEV